MPKVKDLQVKAPNAVAIQRAQDAIMRRARSSRTEPPALLDPLPELPEAEDEVQTELRPK